MDNSEFIKIARKAIKERLSLGDLITKLVNLIDEMEKAENTMFKGVFDLYFMYYPEAASLLKEREPFIETMAKGFERKEVSAVLGVSESSMGYDLSEEDKSMLSLQINELKNISDVRTMTKTYLAALISKNYPNLYGIAGDIVSARLIALSGGIKRLVFMPSSKIQILGSESALFRGSKRTPKYGVIYKIPLIEDAQQDKRGKIARAVAAKISIAAKIDLFSKKDESADLKKQLDAEMERINKAATRKKRHVFK
jgi:nucleolar protein 56